jgi:hypothetical protein
MGYVALGRQCDRGCLRFAFARPGAVPDAVHDEVFEFFTVGERDFNAISKALVGGAEVMGEAGEAGEDAAGEGVDFAGEDGGATAEDATEAEPVDDVAEGHFEVVKGEGVQAALEGGRKEIRLDEIDKREDFDIHLGRRQHKTPSPKGLPRFHRGLPATRSSVPAPTPPACPTCGWSFRVFRSVSCLSYIDKRFHGPVCFTYFGPIFQISREMFLSNGGNWGYAHRWERQRAEFCVFQRVSFGQWRWGRWQSGAVGEGSATSAIIWGLMIWLRTILMEDASWGGLHRRFVRLIMADAGSARGFRGRRIGGGSAHVPAHFLQGV